MSELITRRTFLKAPVLLHWPLPQAVCWQAAAKVMVQPPATRPYPPLTLPITRDFLVVPLAWAHSAALLNQILCMKVTDVVTIISTPPLVFRV